MVLRSGCIIPFQFRDTKKLLMIGVPEENRNLSIWDLKNVVRAAFGVYNFEFRNKKIGFNIPDELLLNYLAQRHDLTNFVIEVGQVGDEILKENLCFEPSCSQKTNIPLPQKSNDSTMGEHAQKYIITNEALRSPLQTNNSNDPPTKMRLSHYSAHTPESLTQSIDPMDIMPKTEDADINEARAIPFDIKQQIMHQQQQHQEHITHHTDQSQHIQHHQHIHQTPQSQQSPSQHSQHQLLIPMQSSPYFPNYNHSAIGGQANAEHSQSFTTTHTSRFRRRGERMSKDQKEMYVKYVTDNPCMLTQRRNDNNLEGHWSKLCNMLNSVQQGANKNVEEWKQTFDAWRYRVFMYIRTNSKLTGDAAKNPKNFKPLTATDHRAYTLWTSHKSTATHDFEKMEVFPNMDDTQADYDY